MYAALAPGFQLGVSDAVSSRVAFIGNGTEIRTKAKIRPIKPLFPGIVVAGITPCCVLKAERNQADARSSTGDSVGANNQTPPGDKVLEDPLAYLPCSTILDFRRGQSIYTQNQPSTNLCLVISGKVKISRINDAGNSVLVDIYQADEFFGESALVDSVYPETADALENTQVMTWAAGEIERLAAARPKLALALLQLVIQRSQDFGCRIESFAVDTIGRRLARTLVRFSERFGHKTESGTIQMLSFTHELLSQYVGTSREIVTQYMNQFRREGYVQYSRQSVVLNADAMKQWLVQQSDVAITAAEAPLSRAGRAA
jgi:CRP/FNR family transcriptional regulator, cyclic AMP receptor protein